MVRIVVCEMMKVTPSIGKMNATDVAKEMVAKNSQSLQGVIEGHMIGTGYHSLAKQIQNRVENVKQPSKPKMTKRKNWHDSDTDEIPLKNGQQFKTPMGASSGMSSFRPLEKQPKANSRKKRSLKVQLDKVIKVQLL